MKRVNVPFLLYVVQDSNKEFCGAYDTLSLARETFIIMSSKPITSEKFDDYISHQGQPEWNTKIIVCELNGNYIWSYDSLHEINEAISNGEKYES